MIGLFNCPITGVQKQHFVIEHSPINDFSVRLWKNRVLNEPIKCEEIVILIIITIIIIVKIILTITMPIVILLLTMSGDSRW